MKKPSLNILHEDLEKVLKKVLSTEMFNVDSKGLVQAIAKESKNYPLKRSLIITNQRKSKKLKRTNVNNAEILNKVLNSERIKLQHRGIRQILKTDKSYAILCDISKDAEQFCEVFNLDLNEGFSEYCKLGLNKIGKNYSINKFRTYKDYIFQTFERTLIISKDSDPDKTVKIASYYIEKSKIIDEEQQMQIFSMYHHDFIYTRLIIVENKANFKSWINSQFDGLEYLDIIPEPYQLHTEEAVKRYLTKGKATEDNWRDRIRNKI